MATLEKIRSKSVFLLIVIGVALLAFIIGDFFQSGRSLFGTGSTVAKVDGKSIEMADFQTQIEQAGKNLQQQGQKVDQAMLQQQVLNNMVAEALFNEEIEALGLTVTDKELTEMMVGRGAGNINQMVQRMGFTDAAMLHDAAFNPSKYQIQDEQAQQLRNYWLSLEDQLSKQLLYAKFMNLFTGTLVANELDAKAIYDDGATTARVVYAAKPFTALADKDYEATEEEIKKEWAAHKQQYAIPEEVRDINYIAVDIVPSEADVTAGEKMVEDALVALNTKNELEGIADNDQLIAQRMKVAKSNIADKSISAFVDSASVGSAVIVRRMANDFTIAKLLGRSSEVDSVNIDLVGLQGTKAELDSVLMALNSGKTDLSAFPAVKNQQDSIWLSLLGNEAAQFRNVIENGATGRYFVTDTLADPTNGTYLMRINTRKAPVPVVDLAVINYSIDPSQATINQLRANLQNFIATNNTSALFAEKAREAGFQLFPGKISYSTPMIGSIPESRDVVVWAMDAKKGKVSEIFVDDQETRYIAAAVNDIYDDYLPATETNVHAMLAAKVRDEKKAAALIEQFAGKANDIQGYAKLMDVAVDSANVNFGQISLYAPGFAGEEVTSRATVTPKGKVVGPVKGQNEVVVYEVIESTTEGRPYDFQESARIYSSLYGGQALQQYLNSILQSNKEVKNNLHKFYYFNR